MIPLFVSLCFRGQRHILILVVHRSSGDDGNLGVHIFCDQLLLTIFLCIILNLCLVEEADRLAQLHAVGFVEGDAHVSIVALRDRRLANRQVANHQSYLLCGQLLCVIRLSILNYARRCSIAEANHAGNHDVIGDNIHDHIQAEVHHDGVFLQTGSPNNRKGNRGVGKIEAFFDTRITFLVDNRVPAAILILVVQIVAVNIAVAVLINANFVICIINQNNSILLIFTKLLPLILSETSKLSVIADKNLDFIRCLIVAGRITIGP